MSSVIAVLNAGLAGRYRVDREVGAGGMATVYLARDLRHERDVAVKVLREELAASVGKERFLREVRIAAALQHPHTLPVYDSGEVGELLFYVMPFIDGKTLREKIAQDGALAVADVARVIREVGDALSEAHRAGIVHRDLKPENIMMRGRHVLVMDFGVAKALSDATGRHALTTLGMALGTPAYMSPEQASGDPRLDHRADIYALGVIAYELLTGDPPFTGSNPQQVLSAHVTTAPAPITERRRMPPALAALVMKCLEKHPGDRWQSVEELVAALNAIPGLDGTPSPTGLPPLTSGALPRRGARWARIAVAAGAAALLVGAGFLWRRDAASRVASGGSGAREFIEVADFTTTGVDTAIGRSITTAVRAYLADQPELLLPEAETRAGLIALGAPYIEGLSIGQYDERRVAALGERAGWKAIVAGSITKVGGQYLIQARLARVGRDTALASVRVEARDTTMLLAKAQELATRLGQRAAALLPTIAAPTPLGFATTSSREALINWAEGARLTRELDNVGALRAWRAAVRSESTFASAAASLAAALWSRGLGAGERFRAAALAASRVGELPARERADVELAHAVYTSDPERQLALVRVRVAGGSPSAGDLNRMALALRDLGRVEEAVVFSYRAATTPPISRGSIRNVLAQLLRALGRRGELDSLYAAWTSDGSITPTLRFRQMALDGRYGDALALTDSIIGTASGAAVAATEVFGAVSRAIPVRAALGARAARVRLSEQRIAALEALELPGDVLLERIDLIEALFSYDGDSSRALASLDSAVRAARIPERYPLDRGYARLAQAYAKLGQPALARAALQRHSREVPMPDRSADSGAVMRAHAEVALAEGRWRDAIVGARRLSVGRFCAACEASLLARAFDRGGVRDSAITQFERFVGQLSPATVENGITLPYALRRLGELYEAAGDHRRAVQRYSDFAELWKGADRELQPAVADVRARIARLQRMKG